MMVKEKVESEGQFTALETAVNRARASSDQTQLIHALIQLGQAFLQKGNVPKALTQFEEALPLSQAIGDQLLEARLWGYKGICLMRLGNSHFAQIALHKSHNMAKAIKHNPLIIDALIQLGLLQQEVGEPTKAISKLEQALAIALFASDKPRTLYLAEKLGNLFFGLEAQEKSLEYYGMALQTAELLAQKPAMCAAKLHIGMVYLADNEFDIATDLFEEALNLATELDDMQAELSALSSLMRTHMGVGKVSMALLYGDHVLSLTREAGDEAAEIHHLKMLTSFLLEQEQYRKAIPYLQRSRELAETHVDWEWQLSVCHSLGTAYFYLDRLDEALAVYEHALGQAVQLQDEAMAAQIYGRLGAVQAELGQTDAAITSARQALEIGKKTADLPLVGAQQMLLAFAYHELGSAEQAVAFCRKAVATYHQLEDNVLSSQAEALLAELMGI